MKSAKFAILFAALCSLQSEINAQWKRIAVLGSSTAYGYTGNPPQFPRDSTWAYRLKDHYKNLGMIDTLYNLAVSSTDPYSAMPTSYVPPPGRMLPDPQHNISKALSMQPDVIVVNFPTNSYDWMPFEEVIFCLQTIRNSANARGIPCYITSTQPRNGFSPSERQRLKELRGLIMSTFGVFAIDFFTDIVKEPELIIKPELDLGDGVHLNARGHRELFTNVLETDIFFFLIPVEFGMVNANRDHANVLVNWQVLQENDVDSFIIEGSRDGHLFEQAGKLPSRGNSVMPRVYNYILSDPDPSLIYFRIKASNEEGKEGYSNAVRLTTNPDYEGGDYIYPTITSSDIFLVHYSSSHNALISIHSASGRKVIQQQARLNPGGVKRTNVSHLSRGMYFFTIEHSGYKKTWSFMKM